MLAAFSCSVVFLVSYLAYHFQVGSVKFSGQGGVRSLYLGILLSHTVLAILAALAMHPLQPWTDQLLPLWIYQNLENAIFANIILACFNMLPILPLDGGRVVTGLLPGRLAARYASTERYGLLIVIGIAFIVPMLAQELGYRINPLTWILLPIFQAVYYVVLFLTGWLP